MTQEEIKDYLRKNLRVCADFDETFWSRNPDVKRLVITLSLEGEVITESRLLV